MSEKMREKDVEEIDDALKSCGFGYEDCGPCDSFVATLQPCCGCIKIECDGGCIAVLNTVKEKKDFVRIVEENDGDYRGLDDACCKFGETCSCDEV